MPVSPPYHPGEMHRTGERVRWRPDFRVRLTNFPAYFVAYVLKGACWDCPVCAAPTVSLVRRRWPLWYLYICMDPRCNWSADCSHSVAHAIVEELGGTTILR